jgi:hypothetical protein
MTKTPEEEYENTHPFEIQAVDRKRENVVLRAGYLLGLSTKTADQTDRRFLLRASRSLRAFAELLEKKKLP